MALALSERPLIYPEYALAVLAAILVGALFPVMQDIPDPRRRRQYVMLQGITLIGAAIGCKLAVLFGELGWPFASSHAGHAGDWSAVALSGRSILGALIFGLLAAEIAKPIMGYPLPPNDRFAAVLPFTLAIGRVGCLLHGCCRGVRCEAAWYTITYSDGIPRHPIAAYEIIFDVAVGIAFIWMVKRRIARGQLFSIFLILYGVFRFTTEFWRETPKLYGGWLSGYQVLSCVAALLGAGFIVKRSVSQVKEPQMNADERRSENLQVEI
jgi:phosphatidylglycerol:prolipoprotein diacylglycerol transferase